MDGPRSFPPNVSLHPTPHFSMSLFVSYFCTNSAGSSRGSSLSAEEKRVSIIAKIKKNIIVRNTTFEFIHNLPARRSALSRNTFLTTTHSLKLNTSDFRSPRGVLTTLSRIIRNIVKTDDNFGRCLMTKKRKFRAHDRATQNYDLHNGFSSQNISNLLLS